MQLTLNVNGEARSVEVDEDTPLLWVIRDDLALTGTKFGCGIAQCGACTVHVDGQAVRACSFPATAVMESSIVYGLTAAFLGRVSVANGAIQEGNFDTYKMLSLAQMPSIQTVIIESDPNKPGGIGEPDLPPIAPALTNAIFAATGKRLRSLPLSAHGIEPA
jgi:hypothetical protein